MQGERKKVQISLLVHKMPFSGEQIVQINTIFIRESSLAFALTLL